MVGGTGGLGHIVCLGSSTAPSGGAQVKAAALCPGRVCTQHVEELAFLFMLTQ